MSLNNVYAISNSILSHSNVIISVPYDEKECIFRQCVEKSREARKKAKYIINLQRNVECPKVRPKNLTKMLTKIVQ